MTTEQIIAELERAVRTARQPHYGYNDTELDNLYDGIAVVEDLIGKLKTSQE